MGCSSEANRSPLHPSFDGEAALADLVELCRRFGPRPAGSEPSHAQRRWIAQRLESYGATLSEQPFRLRDPLDGQFLEAANLIASWKPRTRQRLLIGTHADTRPFPDLEPDPARRAQGYLGANDGGSGVALLLELARHLEGWLAQATIPLGVDLVFFDAEERVVGERGVYCLGSRHFVAHQSPQRLAAYAAAVVIDIVAAPDLTILIEPHGWIHAPQLTHDLFQAAAAVGAHGFQPRIGPAVFDDHLPLLAAGIPAALLIDIRDPAWHTAADLPQRCSAVSLAQVGHTLTHWLLQQLNDPA